MRSSSDAPILPADLKAFEPAANALLAQVRWRPAKNLSAGSPGAEPLAGSKLWRPSTVADGPEDDLVSLLKICKLIGGDAVLLPDLLNSALRAIRTGVCLGFHVARQYGVAAGLRELEAQNSSGRLTQNQQEEFRNKVATSSAAALFSAASYIVWNLGSLEGEKISSAQVEFHGIPEVALANPQAAAHCMLYYLAVYLDPQKSGLVQTDSQMVAMTLRYFGGMIDEIKQRQGSLKYAEFFSDQSWRIVDTSFTLQGFEPLKSARSTSVEFNEVRFEQIVGNRVAKHEAKRLAQRLICYDVRAKMNPFVALGGLQMVRMGYGKPGTGKSLQIAAVATLLKDYCERIGVPFLFWPLPDNIVSTFQGGSAERMLDWMKRFQDEDKIVYGAIDDAENNLEDRTRNGVSAGVREVIGVFLRHTEGAYAIHRGNCAIEIYTNLPEQIDKAVLSRVQSRFPINGAETPHDFLDQDYLWWRKYEEAKPGFIGMKPPKDYAFLDDQKPVKSLVALDSDARKSRDVRIQDAIDKLESLGKSAKDHEFYAEMFAGVQRIYPLFTSRDVRNIQQAIAARIMDFDLPEEWLEGPALFFERDFAAKSAMIQDLMRQNMGKNKSFADLRLAESIKYLDNMATIANVDRERRIAALVEEQAIRGEAARRIAAGPG